MIAFRIQDFARGIDDYLELAPNTSVGIELRSPLFEREQTAGTFTYPITVPASKVNQRLLGFPENLAGSVRAPEYPAFFMIQGNLWKKGIIKYLGFDGQNYKVNFKTDAGDFSSLTRDTSLQTIPYGSEPLSLATGGIYPEASYALFPLRNRAFYGDANPDYRGYLNYHTGGAFAAAQSTPEYPLCPFPFVRFVLDKIFSRYGYALEGDWLGEEWVRRLVLVGNSDLAGNAVDFRRHVPDVKVSELLQALRSWFGLAYLVDANRQALTVARLRDIIADPAYLDWTSKADASYPNDPADANGFTLRQTLEPNDELNKTLPVDWAEYRVGGGREEITTTASTLHTIRKVDSIAQNRNWLVPATEGKGTSATFPTGDNKCSLRLLSYQGMQKDSLNGDYPLGSALNENWAGASLGGRSLRYGGADGVYENAWKDWLEFLSQARPIERTVRLSIEDLTTLDPKRKVMVQGVKMFYDKINLSVSAKNGIGPAKISFLKCRV